MILKFIYIYIHYTFITGMISLDQLFFEKRMISQHKTSVICLKQECIRLNLFRIFSQHRVKIVHCLAKKKQTGKSLQLDNYCMRDSFSAGNKLLNPDWCSEQLLIPRSCKRCLRWVESLVCIKQLTPTELGEVMGTCSCYRAPWPWRS